MARDRARVRPTTRGVVLALVGTALAVAAYSERQAVLLVPAALCLGVVLLGTWWVLGTASRVRVIAPGVLEEGEDAVLRIAADPRQAGDRWATWAPGPERFLHLEGELGEDGGAEVALGRHPRGRWRLAPVEVTSLDPFRVMRSVRTVDPRASLVVGPALLPVPSSSLRSSREAGRQSQTLGADEIDAMVREWRPGDPQRRVHWRQSAKRGQLMVRQEANPATDDLLVLIDTAGADGLGRDAEDRLARAACSIVRALAGRDRVVQVRETGEPSITPADWRDRAGALAGFASLAAVAPAEPAAREAAAAHVVALEEAAPERWTLPHGSTLWLVAADDAPPWRAAPGSRVRVQRWIDGFGPARDLR